MSERSEREREGEGKREGERKGELQHFYSSECDCK